MLSRLWLMAMEASFVAASFVACCALQLLLLALVATDATMHQASFTLVTTHKCLQGNTSNACGGQSSCLGCWCMGAQVALCSATAAAAGGDETTHNSILTMLSRCQFKAHGH